MTARERGRASERRKRLGHKLSEAEVKAARLAGARAGGLARMKNLTKRERANLSSLGGQAFKATLTPALRRAMARRLDEYHHGAPRQYDYDLVRELRYAAGLEYHEIRDCLGISLSQARRIAPDR